MSGFNLSIELQCPQCGAPAELEETCRLFTCGFCRVKSYLVTKDCFRYVLPCPLPEEKELIRVPYWRFKGTLFSYTAKGIHKRFMDISQIALSSPCFPTTLGLRTQAMTLHFLTPELPGYFLHPALSVREIMSGFTKRFGTSLPSPALHQEFIGENLSLIYAPFYADGETMKDAVLDQSLSSRLPPAFSPGSLGKKAAPRQMQFVPTLCPSCGWDLQGSPDALVLTCHNCESAWQPDGDRLERITFGMFPAEEDSGRVWFPFWRIQAGVSGVRLQSYADLIRTANLIKVPQKSDEDREFYFWAPAFKVQPRFIISLSRLMTLGQSKEKLLRKLPKNSVIPVNFPVGEAAESLKMNLAGFIKPPIIEKKRMQEIQVRPRKYLLVYIPFREDPHDYFQEKFQVTVNKNMLKLSQNL